MPVCPVSLVLDIALAHGLAPFAPPELADAGDGAARAVRGALRALLREEFALLRLLAAEGCAKLALAGLLRADAAAPSDDDAPDAAARSSPFEQEVLTRLVEMYFTDDDTVADADNDDDADLGARLDVALPDAPTAARGGASDDDELAGPPASSVLEVGGRERLQQALALFFPAFAARAPHAAHALGGAAEAALKLRSGIPDPDRRISIVHASEVSKARACERSGTYT